MGEERKVLEMLASGQISVEEAGQLLDALRVPQPPRSPEPPKPKKTARLLRIKVKTADERVDVEVTIPLGLAKFVSKFIPESARAELAAQGINLAELVGGLGSDAPEGRLVNLEVASERGEQVMIVVEVI
jgi:hypothetical protein